MSAVTVEFCGLPGAGKSWLAPRVQSTLRAAGVPARLVATPRSPQRPAAARAAAKARLATSQVLREPTQAAVVIAAGLRGPQRRPADRVLRLVHWLAMQERLRRSQREPGVCLFDGGPIQALWSIGLWGDHMPLLTRLERSPHLLQLPDLLVEVRADPRTANDRLARRGSPHSRIEHLGDPRERARHLSRGTTLLDELVSFWERHTGRTALVVHADDPVDPDDPDGLDRAWQTEPGSRCATITNAILSSLAADRSRPHEPSPCPRGRS